MGGLRLPRSGCILEKGAAGLEGKVSIYVVWGAEPRRGTR